MRIQPSYNQSFTDPYSFQAQEHDDEVKGDGNSVNYAFRMHDPRIGRFFAVDPLEKDYPYYTPYQFSGNEVIRKVEVEGLEPEDYLMKKSNVGKTFIAVSHANGQEGKKYYYKLIASSNSISWHQGNRYQPPKPKPVAHTVASQTTVMDSKWISAVKLENTLNSYAIKAWNRGDVGDCLYYKLRAAESGLEGDVGFYRKGIPLMASTVGTILTFGSASLVGGAVAGGAASGTGNFLGQWAQTGDISKVDGLSVGLSAFGGVLKNPWLSTSVTSGLDAVFDLKAENGLSIMGTEKKSVSQGLMDLGFGAVGGTQSKLLEGMGVKASVLNSRSLIIGGLQQYGNGLASDKLKKNNDK